jgi:hypothetical protein
MLKETLPAHGKLREPLTSNSIGKPEGISSSRSTSMSTDWDSHELDTLIFWPDAVKITWHPSQVDDMHPSQSWKYFELLSTNLA